MRRVFASLLCLVILGAALVALLLTVSVGTVAAQDIPLTLPGTNTPPPTALVFYTNTPDEPSPTPSQTFTPSAAPTNTLTPTPTPTYTATFTPTLTPSDTPTPTNTPTPTPTPNGPYIYPEGVNPLTGQPYVSAEAMARRNLMVKVSNFPPVVRPQSGLNAADLVFEYEVEGGVTRFAAIFRNNAPRHVGPVRSGRLVDLELAPMYEALWAYSGSSDPIKQLVEDVPWGFQVFSPQFGDNCEEAGFCRFPQPGLDFEHTLYLDTTVLWDRATRRNVNTGYPARGFAFADTPNPGGQQAVDLFIDWYGLTDARWQYDVASARYLRYTDGVAHYDNADGQQLWADNIVVLEVPHVERPDLFEPESRTASQDIQLWGTGRAYVFRNGLWFEGYWERQNREPGTAIRLYYGNYEDIMLKPGRSYVEIVRWLGDLNVSLEYSDMAATGTAVFLSTTPTPVPQTTTDPALLLSTEQMGDPALAAAPPTSPPGMQPTLAISDPLTSPTLTPSATLAN